MARATAAKTEMSVGKLTDELFELREKKRELDEKVKAIEAQYDALALQLMAQLEEQGADKVSGKKATASVTVTEVATLEDRDALNAFVKKTGNFQLFQARINDAAFRELLGVRKGKPVPGLTSFNKKRLNLRTLSST